jgi:hypothetical protein
MPLSLLQHAERLFAVTREAEREFSRADVAAELLSDQQLEVGLVIDNEDSACGGHVGRGEGVNM